MRLLDTDPYIQETKKNYVLKLLKFDNLSGNTIENGMERRFAETDSGYSNPAYSDLNVQEYVLVIIQAI